VLLGTPGCLQFQESALDGSGRSGLFLLALLADPLILGQATSREVRGAQFGIQQPYAMSVSGGRLAVAEKGSSRVTLWSSVPTSNYQPASAVIGFADTASTQAPVFNYPANAVNVRQPEG